MLYLLANGRGRVALTPPHMTESHVKCIYWCQGVVLVTFPAKTVLLVINESIHSCGMAFCSVFEYFTNVCSS